jgi:hypothetical protein
LHAMRGAGAEIKYKAPRSLSSLPQNSPQRPNYGGDRQIRLRAQLDAAIPSCGFGGADAGNLPISVAEGKPRASSKV